MVFSELPLHGRWLPAEHLRQYMHMKCKIGDEINFTLPTMMRVINKVLPLVSLEPYIMEIPGDIQLRVVFRFMFQNWTRRCFFWVTTKVGIMPLLPSQCNTSAWEHDSVLTRLISRGFREQPALDILDTCFEPGPTKRHKGSVSIQPSTRNTELGIGRTPPPSDTECVPSNGVRGCGWWDSAGDARRLFAPCTILLYGSSCNVKDILMVERTIEILESVNCSATNWKNVVDTGMAGSSFLKGQQYSESDVSILSLRYRSMYLALALMQFVVDVTGNLRTQQWPWWKRCLQHAIVAAMNDVGVKYYSSFATLAKWHRKLVCHRHYFYNAPDTKSGWMPPIL